MIATLQSLGIDQMSLDVRLGLVHDIWDSIIAEKQQSLLSEGQIEELKQRITEDDLSPNDVVPWEQVKADALARLRR